MFTVSQTAKMLGVSRQTILAWINQDIIKASQPNRLYLIPAAEVERIKAGEAIGQSQRD